MGDDFKPGLYRHYKGGMYNAICIVAHHETRQPMVLYVSLKFGGMNVRPLKGFDGDPSGWCDYINTTKGRVQRFEYVGELPSEIPASER